MDSNTFYLNSLTIGGMVCSQPEFDKRPARDGSRYYYIVNLRMDLGGGNIIPISFVCSEPQVALLTPVIEKYKCITIIGGLRGSKYQSQRTGGEQYFLNVDVYTIHSVDHAKSYFLKSPMNERLKMMEDAGYPTGASMQQPTQQAPQQKPVTEKAPF